MSTPTFQPPIQPDFAVLLGYETVSVVTAIESGRKQARAKWHQPLRRFKLRWELADFATVRYLVGFFAAMKGQATAFRYLLPDEALFWPEYPLPVTTAMTSGGALGARTYYVAFSWANAYGETRVGYVLLVSATANNLLKVTVPEFPRGVTSAKVYVGTSAAALKLEATITTSRGSWTEDAAGLAGTGAAPITTSTMAENILCSFAQDKFEPQLSAARLATCELTLEEVSEA